MVWCPQCLPGSPYESFKRLLLNSHLCIQIQAPTGVWDTHGHARQKGLSSLTQFTIAIENSNTSKYSTAVAKKEREGKENNACL